MSVSNAFSCVQLASAAQASTSITPGVISYLVPAPSYGAFTAIVDFTPAAGFIKDVDTVPATLQFTNQGTSVRRCAVAFGMTHAGTHDLGVAT